MKVLWFCNTPANADEYFNRELKGTGGWLKSLDKEIQDKVELYVAFYRDYQHEPFKFLNTNYYPICKFKNKFDKIVTRLTNRQLGENDLHKYLNIVEKVNPDIIHIHGTELPFICITNKVKVPVAVSIQGNITVYNHKFFSGIEERYSKIKANDYFLRRLLYPKTFLKYYLAFSYRSTIEMKYLKQCNHIIGRTDWDRRITRILAPNSQYYHVDEKLRDGFYRNKWKNPDNKQFIIFTTNGNNLYKGFETICQTLNLLNDLGMNITWKIAGVSEKDLIVKVVKKKLDKDYPQKNLSLLGNMHENELLVELLKSNVYIMPSHIENSPNNLCEAMILGMPCIATFAGGTGALLKDGEEGILIQDGDPWVMAGAILEMKDNYNKAIEMGENARDRALIRHDKDKIVDDLIKVYEEITQDGIK